MTEIYQTLEDKGNPDQIEAEGPYLCTRPDAWLGQGYYFWESHLDNAHWWGESCYPQAGYIICKSSYEKDSTLCLDLIDNPEHLTMFKDTIALMEKEKLCIPDKTKIARIIEYLKSIRVFKFTATRASGINSRNKTSKYTRHIRFNSEHCAYIDLCPQIQICFYSKTTLTLSEFKIICPEEYIDGYVV